MKRLIRGVCLACVCSVFALGSVGSRATENVKTVTAEADVELSADKIESKALSLSVGVKGADEPLYAGTSTWFLLSIALLGSIAVQRRTVDTSEQPES